MKDHQQTDTRRERLIQDRQEELENVLDHFSRKAAYVEMDAGTKREIAIRIVNFHRVLSNYQDEAVLSDGDIPDITPISGRLGRTVEVMGESKRRGNTPTFEEVPAVDELDYDYLEGVAHQLETAAKKLGFWAPAESEYDVFGVDPDWEDDVV